MIVNKKIKETIEQVSNDIQNAIILTGWLVVILVTLIFIGLLMR